MQTIELTQGQMALVDDEDFEALSAFKWCAQRDHRTFYAVRHTSRAGAIKRRRVTMHGQILDLHGTPHPKGIDHEYGNGCNNQKYNLRPATHVENGGNRKKQLGDQT